MEKISKHVYWLPPAPPDRPSLCAVEGERATIWLDAGSSPAHTRAFLDALATEGLSKPTHVVPSGGYTVERATPLLAAVRSFAAVRFVEGHSETVLSRPELEDAIAEATATTGLPAP